MNKWLLYINSGGATLYTYNHLRKSMHFKNNWPCKNFKKTLYLIWTSNPGYPLTIKPLIDEHFFIFLAGDTWSWNGDIITDDHGSRKYIAKDLHE